MIPALAQTLRFWAARPGLLGLRVLHDRQNMLTDDRIDVLLEQVRNPLPEFRAWVQPASVASFVRGESHLHPSIQLADLIAGAGRAAAEAALGVRDYPVALDLIDMVRPLIDDDSLWGDDATWIRLMGHRLAQ